MLFLERNLFLLAQLLYHGFIKIERMAKRLVLQFEIISEIPLCDLCIHLCRLCVEDELKAEFAEKDAENAEEKEAISQLTHPFSISN